MRKASSNWLGKLVMAVVRMGVLIVSFGIWGIADILGNSLRPGSAAPRFRDERLRQIYTDKLQQLGRQFGRPLTMDQARAFGLDRQVLQQIIAEAALDEEARRMGLGQSEAETMRMMYADPNFKGLSGNLSSRRVSRPRSAGSATPLNSAISPKTTAAAAPDRGHHHGRSRAAKVLIEALTRFQNEQRSVDYVKLDAARPAPSRRPRRRPRGLFRRPPRTRISQLFLCRDQPRGSRQVVGSFRRGCEEGFRAAPRQDRHARDARQMVFPNAEEALAARGRIASGMSFDDLAKERNPESVRRRPRHDHEIRDHRSRRRGRGVYAALRRGGHQPVQGRFGVALVRIGKIEPGVTPCSESVAQVKRKSPTERARAKVAELHNEMEDERGGGASVIEAAQKLGLTAVTIDPWFRHRERSAGRKYPRGLNVVSRPSRATSASTTTRSFAGGYVWYDVLGITP